MRVAVYLAAVLLGATATPSGYYHQQYNYKTSSSSYKNNELQHKTDDQGYYSKDGDLEGRVKPKVSSNSEHSEYINPQLQERQDAGYIDPETDLTSHGNMLANSYGGSIGGSVSSGYQAGSQYGSGLYSDGLASSDHIGGATSVLGAYGSESSQSSYGSSNLRTVASRLQSDLKQEIQEALRSQSRYSHQVDISELEAELHRNLTARLNTLLQEQYGTQTVRGGQSYSLTEGRLQTRPNYEQHDLENLQRQVENSLVQQLRTDYSHGSSSSRNHQIYNENYGRYESTTTYRPIYPNLNVITTPRPFPAYPGGIKDSYHSQNDYNVNRVSSNVRYTPVPNPLSITTIASNVQSQVDSQLNRLLEQAQTKYFSENSGYSVHNLDSVLERLRQELKNNLTYLLDEELRSQYGTQMQKNNYMFSVGSGGEISGQYNYNVADLENLRRQVESNLLIKLNRDFESARQRWISRQQLLQQSNYERSQSNDYQYGSSSNNQRFDYSTPRYSSNDYYRPTSASIVPLINTGVKGNQYHTISGSQQSNYGSSGSSSNIVELQRHLQSDLSRQLQAAISQNKAYTSRYSTNGGYGGSFEEAYQRLYNDLQRNLTQQLQEYEAGSSGYSSSYGSVSDAQLASLKSQLQQSLASQLQSGLQQSYSASASYSASSGGSASAGAGAYSSSSSDGSYRTARGSQAGYSGYGQYRSGNGYPLEGEDCQGDDPNADRTYRTKRSYGYRSRPLGLSTQSGTGYGGGGYEGYNTGYNGNFGGYSSGGYSGTSLYGQPHRSVGQEVDDSDTMQQVEPADEFTGQQQIDVGQQQIDVGQQQIDVGQQVDDFDDTQQVVDPGFGKIELGSQNKPQASSQQFGQDSYSFHGAGSGGGKLQNGNQFSQSINRKPNGQDTSIDAYGKLEIGSQNHVGQQVDNGNLIRQQENTRYGYSEQNPSYTRKPNIGKLENLQGQTHLGQEIDETDLTQKTEDVNFENPYPKQNRKPFGSDSNIATEVASSHSSNFRGVSSQIQSTTKKSIMQQYEPHYIGQEIDNSDLPQQTEDIDFENTQPKHNRKPFWSNSNIETEVSSSHFSNFGNVASQTQSTTKKSILQQYEPHYIGQEIDNSDLTQQEINFESNQPKYNRKPFGSNSNIGTTEVALNHLSNYGGVPYQSTTKRSVIQFQPEHIGQEIDDTDSTQLVSQSSDFGTLGVRSLVQTSTKKPQLIAGSNFDYRRPNYQDIQTNSQHKPVTQLADPSNTFQQENNFQNSRGLRYSPKPVSSNDFINREVNSQSGTHSNNEPQFINQYSDSLPTLSQVNENNRQPYGGQVATQYMLTTHRTYPYRPWNYPGYATETVKPDNIPFKPLPPKIQQNLDGSGESSLILNKPFEQPIINTENVTPKGQVEWEIGEPGYVPFVDLPQTNTQWIDIEPPGSTVLPVDNLIVDNEINLLSKPNENTKPLSTFNASQINPLDLSNFPPLPPPKNMASVIPAIPIQPPSKIPQQPSSSPKLTKWQINLNEGKRQDQTLIDAEREADLLIEKLREAQENKPIQHVNIQEQESIDSYESHHDSRTYHHRTTNQNSPNQYNIIQVKLQNVTPEQLKIINQIDEYFTKIIEAAVENQVKTGSSYQQSFKTLETALKTNLTQCIEGSVFSHLEVTDVGLKKYSDLIKQNFEENKIPDLNKYLEIKFIKKIKEQLRTAYKVDNAEDAYNFQHGTRSQPERTWYRPPADHEVIQVKLENLTKGQLNIINQMEDDFNKQIEAAIQTHLASVTSGYLYSYENYQKSLNKLEAQIKNNITECVQGATEPGLSKYSDIIVENFDNGKIEKLEKYLEIKLIKTLRENLKTHFKFHVAGSTSIDSNLHTGSLNYNHGYQSYQSSHRYGTSYGQTNNFNTDSEKALEIEPIEYQHATQVIPAPPPYSGSVKGGKISRPHLETSVTHTFNDQNGQHNIENLPEPVDIINSHEIAETTTEKPGWWKRFGNKVKQGATNLKKKIVGTS